MSKSHDKLMERIQACYQYKELIENYPDKFDLKGYTQKQWLQYYDEELSGCAKHLEPSKARTIAIISIFAILLIASFFLFKPTPTSLTIYNPESINFEINKTVSLYSYLLINSGSSQIRINITEFNLQEINSTYEISSLTIPLNLLNLPAGSHLVAISIIDSNEVVALKQLDLTISNETTTTTLQETTTTSSTTTTIPLSTTSTTIQLESPSTLAGNETPTALQISSAQQEYKIQTASSNLSNVYLTLNGRLTYNNNTITKDQGYNFTFTIYNKLGNQIWQENQTINTSSGVYTAVMGTTRTLNIQFNESYTLGISINESSSPTQELSPRLNLTHSPYAYRSNIADNIECDNCVDWYTEISNIPPGISNGTSVLTINASSFIDAGAIKNNTLPDARLSSNVSMLRDVYTINQSYNKSQVYNKTEVETYFVNQSGDTIPGNITITGNLNVTGQSYLNNLNISGITFSQGNITANSFIPSTNNTEDLGSPAGFFRNLYIETIILLTKITGNQIGNNTITTANIQAGTLDQGTKLAGENITSGTISNDRLNSNISQLSQSVGTAELENTSINSMKLNQSSINTTHILDETISNNDINNSLIQLRVNSTCSSGSSIRVVNQDGTVNCDSGSALDSYVNLSSNQTIPGFKTFSNTTFTSNITPVQNNTYSLGNETRFFQSIYVNVLNIIARITGSQIADETITSTNIKDENVGSAEIQNLSIQSIDLASYQINNTHITLNAINGSQIAVYSLNNTHISLNSINGSQIVQLSINNSHIASFSINNTQIKLDSINTSQIVDGTIQGSDINSNANLTLLDLITNGQASLANVTISNNLTVGTQTLVVITNGTTNKVGINTTSPTTALDIRGQVNLSSPTSTNNLLQIGSGVHSNITMFSQDGTRWTCGVLNSGAMNCTSF